MTNELMALADRCPSCDADFDGGPIPENILAYYSPPYRWSRKIGLSDGDNIFAWHCPDCGHEWPSTITQEPKP